MNTKVLHHVLINFLLVSVVLSACSTLPSSGAGAQGGMASPTPVQVYEIDILVERSYHTVLMVERAADLIMVALEKIQAGEIQSSDVTAVQPYLNAFIAALEDYNRTTPPPGILNHAWETASRVTVQYGNVYTAMIKGKAISANDLASLRILRQLLTNYQSMAESYLTRRGLGGPAYYSSQFLAVESHLQKVYGDKPVPPPIN